MGRRGRRASNGIVYSTASQTANSQSPDLPFNSIVASVTIQDPYEPAKEANVIRSLRDDPLAAIYVSRQINEAAFIAGRRWQQLYELSQVGAIQAANTTKEPVDGGGINWEPITQKQIQAQRELHSVKLELGNEGSVLVHDVLGQGLTISAIAQSRNLITERDRRYLGQRFRECLDTLAVFFGYAMRK